MVVTVGRTLEGCGKRTRKTQAEAVAGSGGRGCERLTEATWCLWLGMGLDLDHDRGSDMESRVWGMTRSPREGLSP